MKMYGFVESNVLVISTQWDQKTYGDDDTAGSNFMVIHSGVKLYGTIDMSELKFMVLLTQDGQN
jgi:hypothetical protein